MSFHVHVRDGFTTYSDREDPSIEAFTEFEDADELTIWESGLIEAKRDDNGERVLFSPAVWTNVQISQGHTRIKYPK